MASVGANRGAVGDSIYPYETAAGTRYYFKYRDSAGRQSTRRGFLTLREARADASG